MPSGSATPAPSRTTTRSWSLYAEPRISSRPLPCTVTRRRWKAGARTIGPRVTPPAWPGPVREPGRTRGPRRRAPVPPRGRPSADVRYEVGGGVRVRVGQRAGPPDGALDITLGVLVCGSPVKWSASPDLVVPPTRTARSASPVCTPVHVQHLARDVAGLGRGQEGDGGRDVRGGTGAARRRGGDEVGTTGVRKAVAEELRVGDVAGRDDVRGDAAWAELTGQVKAPGDEPCFDGPVGAGALVGGDRADVDDRAAGGRAGRPAPSWSVRHSRGSRPDRRGSPGRMRPGPWLRRCRSRCSRPRCSQGRRSGPAAPAGGR